MGQAIYLSGEGREHFERLLPVLLRAEAANPQPETALSNLESFTVASGAMASYFAIFVQNPALFELLLLAFGSGDSIAHTLIAHPEFLDTLADSGYLASGEDRSAMAARLAEWTAGAQTDERLATGLARFKRFEFLTAGLGELAGLLEYAPSGERITATAETIVAHALAHIARQMGLEQGPGSGGGPPHFAILAMGKLGTGELTWHSDLDIIFVWEDGFAPGDPSPSGRAAELGERLVALLTHPSPEGQPFAIDVRLRPEGQNAPLTPTLGRYLEYYAGDRAQLWEFQSAMKLRPIAGDVGLAQRLMRELGAVIARRCEGLPLAEQIRAMRRRMEESIKLPRWVFADFKSGPGGSVDLEFAAQYLQLRHLSGDPGLMGLGPLAVFGRSAAAGRISEAKGAELARDYVWLRRLERRARLLFESERSWLPARGDKLTALERACRPLLGQHSGPLRDEVARLMLRNRRSFTAIVAE